MPTTNRIPKQSVSDLAEFYYERANARLLLGRYAEAAADAEKALAIASEGGDPMLKQRIRQFVGHAEEARWRSEGVDRDVPAAIR